jgi:hypothetical protein
LVVRHHPDWQRRKDRRHAGLFALLLLITLGAAIAVYATEGENNQPSQEVAAFGRGGKTPMSEGKEFALLATQAEGLPPAVQEVIGKPTMGLAWDSAQKLRNVHPGQHWLVPGPNILCLFSHRAGVVGSSCSDRRVASKHSVAVVGLSAPGHTLEKEWSRLIIGVAPAETKRIAVEETDGSTNMVPVRSDGVFIVKDQATNPPKQLVLR